MEDYIDWMHLFHWERLWAMSPIASSHWLLASRRPEPHRLHLPTWPKLTVEDFMDWCHVSVWPPLALFQPEPMSANISLRGRRWLVMRNTCPSHLNRYSLITPSTDLASLANTRCLTSILLTLLYQLTWEMERRQLWSKTVSLLMSSIFNSHVSQAQWRRSRTAAQYTRRLIGSQPDITSTPEMAWVGKCHTSFSYPCWDFVSDQSVGTDATSRISEVISTLYHLTPYRPVDVLTEWWLSCGLMMECVWVSVVGVVDLVGVFGRCFVYIGWVRVGQMWVECFSTLV